MIDIDKLVVSLLQWPHVHINRDDVLEALKDQDIEYCNGELLNHSLSNKSLQNTENTKPKFKVGDTIRSKKYGNKYIKTIKEILNDAYLFTDEKVLSFEFEDKWELVEPSIPEIVEEHWDEIVEDKSNPNNLHQYLYGTLTEFEQCLKSGTNIYVEQGRHMEDWDAREDAKELLDIARKKILAEEIELAYKTRDEVMYNKGKQDAIKDFYNDFRQGEKHFAKIIADMLTNGWGLKAIQSKCEETIKGE